MGGDIRELAEEDAFAREKQQLEELKKNPKFEKFVKNLLRDYSFLQQEENINPVSDSEQEIEELLQENADILEREKQEEANRQTMLKLEEAIQENMTIEQRFEYIRSLQERGQYFLSQDDRIQKIDKIATDMKENFDQLHLSLGKNILFYVVKIENEFRKLGIWNWDSSDTVIDDVLTAKHKVGDIVDTKFSIHINGSKISKSDYDGDVKAKILSHIEDIQSVSRIIIKELELANETGNTLFPTLYELTEDAKKHMRAALTSISTGILGTGKYTGYQEAMDNLIAGIEQDIDDIQASILAPIFNNGGDDTPQNYIDTEKLIEKLKIYSIQFQDTAFVKKLDDGMRNSLRDKIGNYDIRNEKEVKHLKYIYHLGNSKYLSRDLDGL